MYGVVQPGYWLGTTAKLLSDRATDEPVLVMSGLTVLSHDFSDTLVVNEAASCLGPQGDVPIAPSKRED